MHGVFAWTERNRYPAAEAVAIYRREHAADSFAAKLNAKPYPDMAPRGYVVRPISGGAS